MHALATGRVQGVGFRATVHNHAKILGITGFVRNLPNGSVEIVAQGTKAELQQLIHLLKTQNGAAEISSLQTEFYTIQKLYLAFTVEK